MVEGGGGTEFPVIFYDGEREINIGSVRIDGKQVYKSFQFMLAHKIGISPNQISIYLIDRKNPKWPETRRKFPITARANFSQICKEKDCSVLVVLKRSRKTRTRKGAVPMHLSGSEFDFTPRSITIPENVILLRREHDHAVNCYDSPFYDQITPVDYAVAMAQQRYHAFPRMGEAVPMMTGPKYFCEECRIAEKNGGRADFHHCVNDVVVEEFRVAGAGPIGPIRWPDINVADT